MAKLSEKYIVVNATALDQSGALSILRQFIENIPVDQRKWLILISPNVDINVLNANVRLEPIQGVKPMHKRLWWDMFGLNVWLKKNNIDPIACISLQNTGFRVSKKNIPHFIYYHNSIPFYSYKWNPFKKAERVLWFYKNIYPLFVNLFLTKDTRIFVQLDFIKHGFVKRFGHPEENVYVYSPSVISTNTSDADSCGEMIGNEYINLFYPATGFFYKNHKIVYDALKKVDEPVKLYVTLPVDMNDKRIVSTGQIPFKMVCALYRNCDALVFPSYIETFGLPLIEAAMTGLPIIAADLPYAREVLAGYDGVTYVSHNDSRAWAQAISNIKKGQRYNPLDISKRPGWTELFKNITSKL